MNRNCANTCISKFVITIFTILYTLSILGILFCVASYY